MAQEIERKFLLNSDGWRDEVHATLGLRQGYIASSDTCSVRVRITNDKADINIKSMTLGVQRQEFEYAIPLPEAEQMLATLAVGPLLEKNRHLVRNGRHTWEVDEFFGDNAGLLVAEIELTAIDETFAKPPWLGAEVTDDKRYYNHSLVSYPYTDWE